MPFVLTEEQQMLKDSANEFAVEQLAVAQLRKLRDDNASNGFNATTWAEMAQLGWCGVLVPEKFGGSEFGYLGLGQILEAQGKTIASTPLLQTALIGASALQLGDNDAAREEYLPKIAQGEVRFALAVDDTPHHAPASLKTTATKSGDDYVLSGEKSFVIDGGHADVLLIAAQDDKGPALFLVPADTTGISRQTLNTLDAHAAANVTLSDVKVPATARLGGEDVLTGVLDRARIGYAAEMLGLSQQAFEITLEYLKTRKQFGQLIGSFQSLQHRAAIMFSELEQTRSCIGAAFDALDSDSDNIAALASLAKARASETAHLVTNEMVQMHGGIGMTDEHDSGLYMKRSRVLENLYGGEGYHRDRFASLNNF